MLDIKIIRENPERVNELLKRRNPDLSIDEVIKIDGVKVYGDFSSHAAIVSLNVKDYDSGEVSDALSNDYGIATRPGAHCAPRLHIALGTKYQGAVRFSFSYFTTKEELDAAVNALKEIAS